MNSNISDLYNLVRGKTSFNKIVNKIDKNEEPKKKRKPRKKKVQFQVAPKTTIIDKNNNNNKKPEEKKKEELKPKEKKKSTYDKLKGSLYESAEKPRRLDELRNNKRTKSPSSSTSNIMNKNKSFFNETVNFIPRDEHGRVQYPSIYHSAIGSPKESRMKSKFKTPRKKKSHEEEEVKEEQKGAYA